MDQDSRAKVAPRLRVVYIGFGLLFCILIGGLAKVQLVDYGDLKEQQARQNYRRILIPGPRGDIYDRDGRLLVGNRPLLSAVVYLNELRKEFRQEYYALVRLKRHDGEDDAEGKGEHVDSHALAVEARRRVVQRYMNQVNRILGRAELVDPKDIERHFSRQLLLPMPLLRDLTPEEYARLTEQLPVDSPIQIVAESARYYPFDDCAAHTLGFVVNTKDGATDDSSVGSDDLRTFRYKGKVGKTGIEAAFDSQLQGTTGGEVWVVDPSGFQYKRIEYQPPTKGHDVVTSLDLDLQLTAERALGDKTGAVVVMDVRTGEVLAMVSKPAYNLNDLTPYLSFAVDKDIRERGAWINRAVQGLYAPGSTFKIVSSVAGLMAGVITDNTVINCPGYLMVGNRKFKCDNHDGHGDLDLEHAIGLSCDVFYYTVGLEMGIDRLAATARMFGLGEPTGIQLPADSRSTVVPDEAYKKGRDLGPWYVGDTANTSIGQGYLLVTPLQMCDFAASIARDWTRTRPTLLKVPDGSPPPPQPGTKIPLSDHDYRRVLAGMRLAATEGTARLAQKDVEMPVAAKTGTAQVWLPGGHETSNAWLIAFAPYDHPEIAVSVLVQATDPDEEYWGGSEAAPIAREVFRMYEAKHKAALQASGDLPPAAPPVAAR